MTTPVNHSSESIAKLLDQYKETVNLNAILATFIEQIQEVEDIYNEFSAKLALATATGQQLDNIGTILNVQRTGKTDVEFKNSLYFAISQHFSEGTITDVLNILNSMIAAVDLELKEVYPASFLITANDPTIEVEEASVLETINQSKIAGVGFDIISSNLTPFAFLEYVAKNNTPSGYDDLLNPGNGGIYSRIFGSVIPAGVDEYLFSQDLTSRILGESLLGVAADEFTARFEQNPITVDVQDVGGDKTISVVNTPVAGWSAASFNNVPLTQKNYIMRFRVRQINGIRWGVVLNYNSGGGYVLLRIDALNQLLFFKFTDGGNNWDILQGYSVVHDFSPYVGAIDEVIIYVKDNNFTFVFDGVEQTPIFENTYDQGTIGIVTESGGWRMGECQILTRDQ